MMNINRIAKHQTVAALSAVAVLFMQACSSGGRISYADGSSGGGGGGSAFTILSTNQSTSETLISLGYSSSEVTALQNAGLLFSTSPLSMHAAHSAKATTSGSRYCLLNQDLELIVQGDVASSGRISFSVPTEHLPDLVDRFNVQSGSLYTFYIAVQTGDQTLMRQVSIPAAEINAATTQQFDAGLVNIGTTMAAVFLNLDATILPTVDSVCRTETASSPSAAGLVRDTNIVRNLAASEFLWSTLEDPDNGVFSAIANGGLSAVVPEIEDAQIEPIAVLWTMTVCPMVVGTRDFVTGYGLTTTFGQNSYFGRCFDAVEAVGGAGARAALLSEFVGEISDVSNLPDPQLLLDAAYNVIASLSTGSVSSSGALEFASAADQNVAASLINLLVRNGNLIQYGILDSIFRSAILEGFRSYVTVSGSIPSNAQMLSVARMITNTSNPGDPDDDGNGNFQTARAVTQSALGRTVLSNYIAALLTGEIEDDNSDPQMGTACLVGQALKGCLENEGIDVNNQSTINASAVNAALTGCMADSSGDIDGGSYFDAYVAAHPGMTCY